MHLCGRICSDSCIVHVEPIYPCYHVRTTSDLSYPHASAWHKVPSSAASTLTPAVKTWVDTQETCLSWRHYGVIIEGHLSQLVIMNAICSSTLVGYISPYDLQRIVQLTFTHVLSGCLLQVIMQQILAYLRSGMERWGRQQTNSCPRLAFSKHSTPALLARSNHVVSTVALPPSTGVMSFSSIPETRRMNHGCLETAYLLDRERERSANSRNYHSSLANVPWLRWYPVWTNCLSDDLCRCLRLVRQCLCISIRLL